MIQKTKKFDDIKGEDKGEDSLMALFLNLNLSKPMLSQMKKTTTVVSDHKYLSIGEKEEHTAQSASIFKKFFNTFKITDASDYMDRDHNTTRIYVSGSMSYPSNSSLRFKKLSFPTLIVQHPLRAENFMLLFYHLLHSEMLYSSQISCDSELLKDGTSLVTMYLHNIPVVVSTDKLEIMDLRCKSRFSMREREPCRKTVQAILITNNTVPAWRCDFQYEVDKDSQEDLFNHDGGPQKSYFLL